LRVETQTNINDDGLISHRVSPLHGDRMPRSKHSETSFAVGAGVFYYRVGEDLTLQSGTLQLASIRSKFIHYQNPTFFPVIPPSATLNSFASPTIRQLAGTWKTPYSITEAKSASNVNCRAR